MPCPTSSRTTPNPAPSATRCTAWPMSPTWLPSRGLARCRPRGTPGSRSSSRSASGAIAPTGIVVAESACSPSSCTPTSTLTMLPSRSTRLARGDAVHDLLVDRRAEGLGKAVEPLEGRRGALVAADELLGLGVELLGRDARPHHVAHQRQRAGDDPARRGPWSRSPGRLERDHRAASVQDRGRTRSAIVVDSPDRRHPAHHRPAPRTRRAPAPSVAVGLEPGGHRRRIVVGPPLDLRGASRGGARISSSVTSKNSTASIRRPARPGSAPCPRPAGWCAPRRRR